MSYEPEFQLSRRLARVLDQGVLGSYELERLRLARQRALERAAAAGPATRLVAWLDLHAAPLLRSGLSVALVLAVALAGDYLGLEQARSEAQRVDGALLVDDLPINAYLDEGFRAWIAAGSES